MKSPPPWAFSTPHVHPRLRKRPQRCTSLYLVIFSNGPHCSKNLPVKFGFSPKTVPANIAQKLPPQRCPQPLLVPIFNFSHKWPTFAFTPESGYTLAFANRIAHNVPHAETGDVSDGGGITTLGAFRTFTNIPGPGIRTASFAAFGAWSGVLPKNAESLRNSDALMRVAVPKASRPRWAALPAASMHSACFSGMERLDQAFRQSYYHTQLTERAAVWRLCGNRFGR